MSNVFSSEFWRSLYFRATGGQPSDVEVPAGQMAAFLSGSSSLVGTLVAVGEPASQPADTHDGVGRKVGQKALEIISEAQDNRRKRERKDRESLASALRKAFGIREPEPEAPAPAPEPEPVLLEAVQAIDLAADEAALLEAARLKAQKDEDDALIILLLAA